MNEYWAWYCKRYTADNLDQKWLTADYPWCFFIGTKKDLEEYLDFGQKIAGTKYKDITKRPLTIHQWTEFIFYYLIS